MQVSHLESLRKKFLQSSWTGAAALLWWATFAALAGAQSVQVQPVLSGAIEVVEGEDVFQADAQPSAGEIPAESASEAELDDESESSKGDSESDDGESDSDKKEGGKKEGDKKENDSDDEEKDKKKSKDKKQTDGVVKRPDKPPRVPDPREFDAKPVKGRIKFNFTGQAWPDVLQWLANISGYSLDWQELPGGYLNLTTQRSYSLAEARNLINGRLQTRGYVMLLSGEVLTISKIETLDPSLVPRVTEEGLYDLQPHDFVKVTFQLPEQMEVKQAMEDVKQTLRKSPRVLPLAATRRLLVIDSVANLRMVSALLNEERIEQQGQEIPREFTLKFARAEKIINTLYVVLGLDPASQPSQMELQVQQMKMQLLMQMQGAGKDVSRMLNRDGPPVYLAFNRHRNSILVNAPERELNIIERTIAFLDIPARGSAAATHTAGADAPRTAKTYELDTIEPRNLIQTLEEIGDLDPLTELRSDNQAKILFARATTMDHEKIAGLIKQLDREGQQFEVFWLSRLPADAVAGTILALLGEEEEEDDRYRDFYWGYDDRNKNEQPALRVNADIQDNRLLVRGTEEQILQVRTLLAKMGELSTGPSSRGPMVMTDRLDPAATRKLLDQLRSAWPTLGGGAELTIQGNPPPGSSGSSAQPVENRPQDRLPADGASAPAAPGAGAPAEVDQSAGRAKAEAPHVASHQPGPFRLLATTTTTDAASDAAGNATAKPNAAQENGQPAAPAAEGPKASITVTPDGRLMLSATDTGTLSQLEQLVESLTPVPDLYKEFTIEHASAYYIHWKLEDYFEDEMQDDSSSRFRSWRRDAPREKAATLSKRKKLRLIYNSQTNSIVAANATPGQLTTISNLINTWDKPPRTDRISNRRTGMVKIQYSQAGVIAAALKDVYRDLLSSRDEEFDTGEEKGGGFTLPRTTQIEFSGPGSAAVSKTKPIEVGFDGAMSIGVDELANMLVISADRELFDSVIAMARTLDEEARPRTTVQVHRIDVSAEAVRRALDESLSNPWPGGRPQGSWGRSDRRRRR